MNGISREFERQRQEPVARLIGEATKAETSNNSRDSAMALVVSCANEALNSALWSGRRTW